MRGSIVMALMAASFALTGGAVAETRAPTAAETAAMFTAAGCVASSGADASRAQSWPLSERRRLVEIPCEAAAYNFANAYFLFEVHADDEPFWEQIVWAVNLGIGTEEAALSAERLLWGGAFDPARREFTGFFKYVGWGGCGRRVAYGLDQSNRPYLLAQWEWDFCDAAQEVDFDEVSRRLDQEFDSFLVYRHPSYRPTDG